MTMKDGMTFLMVLALLIWLCVVAGLFVGGFIAWADGYGWRGAGMIAVALVVASVGITVLSGLDDDDPYPNRLCRRGHQEWRTEQTPPMLVGKVMIPGQTRRVKVWVCDEWEQ